jgi:hypothetical protein
MERPRVRFSLRWKITLPFMILALLLGLGATYLVSGFLATSGQERFLRQLSDSGQQALDGVVRTEDDLLAIERLVANTDGVFQAVEAGDAEDLRNRILPLVINSGADLVAVLDADGLSLLTVRQKPGGLRGEYETLRAEAYYAEWEVVQAILNGDFQAGKLAGLETLALGEGGRTDVFLTGGPVECSGRCSSAVMSMDWPPTCGPKPVRRFPSTIRSALSWPPRMSRPRRQVSRCPRPSSRSSPAEKRTRARYAV